MPYQEPLRKSVKRLQRVTNYAGALQFGGRAVLGKGIALLKVPLIAMALFSLGFVYNGYLLSHRSPDTELLFREVDELLQENSELVTELDIRTLRSAAWFTAICALGMLLYLRGKSDYRKQVHAQHNGMDLLFHIKSRYIPQLVRRMWYISFEQESRIFAPDSFGAGNAQQRYERFARQVTVHCERSDTPQLVQRHRLNFSLALYEQWLKYPLFSEEDSLASIYEYRSESIAIRRRTAILENYMPLVLSKMYVSFWHSLTTAKAKYLIWKATEVLNRQFALPAFITPEVVVWKCAEQDGVIASVVGSSGLEELNRRRRQLAVALFSADPIEARKHILLMFQKDIVNAFKIRFRYDPNYCAGELPTTPETDLERLAEGYGFHPIKLDKCRRVMRTAREERAEVEALILQHELHWLSAVQVRALRIAYHIDEDKLRSRLTRGDQADIVQVIDQLRCPHYVGRKTAKLQFARGSHLLSTFAADIYLDIYRQLMGDSEPEPFPASGQSVRDANLNPRSRESL